MLDIKYIRENKELVKANVITRGVDSSKADTDKLLKIDSEKNLLQKKIEELRQKRNVLSKSKPTPEQIEEAKSFKTQIEELEASYNKLNKEFTDIMLWFPNLSSGEMPEGKTSEDNIEIKAWRPDKGYLNKDEIGKGEFSGQFMPDYSLHSDSKFDLKDHVELGKIHKIIDVEQSAKVSGSRFTYLLGDAVRLQWALASHLNEKLLSEGWVPMVPPLMVKERSLYGTSHFPGDADQVYSIDSDKVEDKEKMYLVGSSEPSNFSYFMDKVMDEKELPFKVFANTSCFRSEVGSWGKDVKGIKRVHQFDKLEIDVVCKEEESKEIHEYLLSINEWLLQSLKLPYHIINMCKGDAGYYATYKKYDIEVWLPTGRKYIEVGSDTNAIDYQARRMNIKYRAKDGTLKYAHTVNDTGIPFGRMLICILENYQQPDGSILIPEVLQKYMGKDKLEVKS